jgi:hypothetical protein
MISQCSTYELAVSHQTSADEGDKALDPPRADLVGTRDESGAP